MDSTIWEVHGHHKQGAAYGYTKKLGYHPILATRAGTGEVLHARLRKGSSQRGTKRFVEELVARVRRAGATGAVCLRADGGFWSHALIDTLGRLGIGYSITVRVNKAIRACIEAIDPDAWVPIAYPDGGEAAVAQTTYTTGRGRKRRSYRLVVRRSRLTEVAQQALWPNWRYHAFVTSSTTDAVTADQFHRERANVELAIRDLKEGAGLEHCPSGRFFANAAWLACAVLAHNIYRWITALGGIRHGDELTVARTLRTQLIAVPARLVNHAGTPRWRGPLDWPWAAPFTRALTNLRALRPVPTQTATRGPAHPSRTPGADNRITTNHQLNAPSTTRGPDRDLSPPHRPTLLALIMSPKPKREYFGPRSACCGASMHVSSAKRLRNDSGGASPGTDSR